MTQFKDRVVVGSERSISVEYDSENLGADIITSDGWSDSTSIKLAIDGTDIDAIILMLEKLKKCMEINP